MAVPTDRRPTCTTSAICGSARRPECGRRDADAESKGVRGVYLAADRHSTRVIEAEEVGHHEETCLSALSFDAPGAEVAVGSDRHNRDHVAIAHNMVRSKQATGTDSQTCQSWAGFCMSRGVAECAGYSADCCTIGCPTVARLAQTCCSWSWRSYERRCVSRALRAPLEESREKNPEYSLRWVRACPQRIEARCSPVSGEARSMLAKATLGASTSCWNAWIGMKPSTCERRSHVEMLVGCWAPRRMSPAPLDRRGFPCQSSS